MTDPLSAGLEALRAKDLERAIPLLSEAARQNPAEVKARMALGAALGEAGRWLEAVAALQEATALAPGVAAGFHNLGPALERADCLDDAREAYRRAVALDPGHERAAAALRRLVDTPLVEAPAWPIVGGPAPPIPGAPVPGAPVPPASAPRAGAYNPLGPGGSGISPEVAAPPPPHLRVHQVVSAVKREEPIDPTANLGPQLLGEAPPAVEDPRKIVTRPPPSFVDSKMPSVSAILIWLVIAAVFGVVGYQVYKWWSVGSPEQIARATVERRVRQGYASMERGLELPDARYLAPYLPVNQRRPLNSVDIHEKTNQLLPLKLKCDVLVEKIDLTVDTAAKPIPKVTEAVARIAVTLSGMSMPERTLRGQQVWYVKDGAWKPKPDPANWQVFEGAPMTFEPWRGG